MTRMKPYRGYTVWRDCCGVYHAERLGVKVCTKVGIEQLHTMIDQKWADDFQWYRSRTL